MTGKKLFNGSDYKEVLKENKECDIDFTDPILKDLPPSGLIHCLISKAFFRSCGPFEKNAVHFPAGKDFSQQSHGS